MRKKFVTDSLIYLIPGLLHRGIGVLLVPLYARVLSPADYGVFDMLAVFASIVNLTIALEISQAIVRFSVDQPPVNKRRFASTGLWFASAMYLLFFVIAMSNASTISSAVFRSSGHESVFRLYMVYVLLSSWVYVGQNQLRFDMRSTEYMWMSALVTAVTAGVGAVLAYGLKLGLTGIILGMIAGAGVGVVYGYWQLRHVFVLCFDRAALRAMLKYSLPLVPASVAVFANTYIDRIMIANMLGMHEVGLYGMAFRVASLLGLVVAVVAGALHPIVFNNASREQTPVFIAQVFRVFVAFIFVMWVALVVFSREIFELFTTADYLAASGLLVFLAPVLALANMYVFTPGMHLAKRTQTILLVCVLSAGVNAFANLVLIPIAGVTGAAIATLIGYSVFFAAYVWFSQKLYRVPFAWRPIAVCFALILLLISVTLGSNTAGLYRVAFGVTMIALAGASGIVTGLVRMSELREAFGVLSGMVLVWLRPVRVKGH